MVRTIIFSALALLGTAGIGAVVLIAAHSYGYVSAFPDPSKQIELLAVYLAAATLVMGAVAIVVALLGIVGYAAIKAEAIAAATRAGREAGERAIQPVLQREMMTSQLSVSPQADEPTLDPLTQALSRKE